MTTAHLLNTCPACGAEESLDNLLLRMIDDDQVRRLIADVITRSLPLGGLVIRYLRLHKPAKQRLTMKRVHAVLGELVPDLLAQRITRKGREWQVPAAAWTAGFEACFEAANKGNLKAPLDGNAYLYEVLMRQADKAEATQETEQQAAGRSRSYTATPANVGAVIAQAFATGMTALPHEAPPVPAALPTAPGTSPTVRAFQAEIKRKREERMRTAVGPGADTVPAIPSINASIPVQL